MAHKSTKEILQLMLTEYRKGLKGPHHILHEFGKEGVLSAYELNKARNHVYNHMVNVERDTISQVDWFHYDVIPNESWYNWHIFRLKKQS